ncbi:hypothetical protein AAC691_19700 [Nguyenibacter vanlangensis]|uniref:CopG family transcriptional regulator n=1 Tax=Nguyenibacter vanlangensis TaxID=1216886 RepID=A0ABZ3D467_9PROT
MAEKTKAISLKLPESLVTDLDLIAAMEWGSRSNVIRTILKRAVVVIKNRYEEKEMKA